MRKMFVATLVGLMLLPATMATAGPPAESGVVVRSSVPGTDAIAGSDDGLLVLVNVTSVEDYCNDEAAGAGQVKVVEVPSGALVVSVADDDVPVVVVPLADPDTLCEDAANYPVIATGTAHFRLSDNDAEVSGARGNVFGSQLQGTVTDNDGARSNLTAFFRVRITPDGDDRLLRSDVKLTPR